MSSKFILHLYIAGATQTSKKFLKNLELYLDRELKDSYTLKIIDVLKNPQAAEQDKILATPTLARIHPTPVKKVVGDLSDVENVLLGLDLSID